MLGGALKKKLRRAKGGAKNLGVFRVNNNDFTSKNHIFPNCGGRREHFWGISCEKSRFYAKKSYFFHFRGGGRTGYPLDPPWELLTLRGCLGSLLSLEDSMLLIFWVFCVVLYLLSSSCVLCTQRFPVSLDCPFLIAPSVFSNVYIGRSILDNSVDMGWTGNSIAVFCVSDIFICQQTIIQCGTVVCLLMAVLHCHSSRFLLIYIIMKEMCLFSHKELEKFKLSLETLVSGNLWGVYI